MPTSTALQRTIVNPVIKDQVTFIKTAAETNGSYTELEVKLMPGGGTPLHYHKLIKETFRVISGRLWVESGYDTILLRKEAALTVPPGIVHRFYNDGYEPVVFRTVIQPGSEGFEQSLRILYGLAGDGLTNNRAIPKKLTHLAIISAISDMHTAGAMGLMSPILKWLAARAARSGEAQALIDRYCK